MNYEAKICVGLGGSYPSCGLLAFPVPWAEFTDEDCLKDANEDIYANEHRNDYVTDDPNQYANEYAHEDAHEDILTHADAAARLHALHVDGRAKDDSGRQPNPGDTGNSRLDPRCSCFANLDR